jgi:hypothetical protein
LNLAHDLLRERRTPHSASSTVSATAIDDAVLRRRIASMQSAIDHVLAGQEKPQ